MQPKKLFLLDSVGALISALMLALFYYKFQSWIGLPKQALFYLSVIPCIYALYSLVCYLRFNKNWRLFLKIIAIANLMYCFLTLSLVVRFYSQVTILGLIYFAGEIIIIVFISVIELKTASKRND